MINDETVNKISPQKPEEPFSDILPLSDKIEIDSKNLLGHGKKDSIVSKFLQRLSKPDIHSKPKKSKADKTKSKPSAPGNQSQEFSVSKTICAVENGHNDSPRSKKFRKIFKRFRKVKADKLSESASCQGSGPLRSIDAKATTNVNCVGSCNDVTVDLVCREEFEKYNSPSVDCILDYQARKLLKDRESMSSTSDDLRDHEEKMNASNTQIVSIFPDDNDGIKKLENRVPESSADKDATCIETEVINIEDSSGKADEAASDASRPKNSLEESDVLLRKSNRPTEIQLRRSRVTSQSSVARNSLIMVAVAHNSLRIKCTGNQPTTPIGNQDSPNCTGKKMDFEEDGRVIEEEKSESTVTEKNGNDFLKIVNQYETEINGKISIVQQYMKTFMSEMSEDVIGQLHTTVGLAKLLLSEKFVQFRGLCHQNLSETAENGFKTLCCDLEGYLMTLEIQIADLEKNFQLVEKIRENNWQMPSENEPKVSNGIKKKKKPHPNVHRVNATDNQRSAEAKKRIAEYKKMCASKVQDSTNLLFVE